MLRNFIAKCILMLFLIQSIFFTSTQAENQTEDLDFLSGTPETRSTIKSSFGTTNVLHQPGGSLAGGIACGDPDNDLHDEVVVVGGSGEAGRVTVIEYNETKKSWDTPTIWIDHQACRG